MKSEAKFFTAQAWVQGAWAHDVLLTVADNGHWHSVQPNATAAQQQGATRLAGPVLPGLVNAHSHAFQRAIVGLTERRSSSGAQAADDFWSWRDRMYSAANRISPEQLEAIASSFMPSCWPAATPRSASFITCTTTLAARPTPTRSRCRWRWCAPRSAPASA